MVPHLHVMNYTNLIHAQNEHTLSFFINTNMYMHIMIVQSSANIDVALTLISVLIVVLLHVTLSYGLPQLARLSN